MMLVKASKSGLQNPVASFNDISSFNMSLVVEPLLDRGCKIGVINHSSKGYPLSPKMELYQKINNKKNKFYIQSI